MLELINDIMMSVIYPATLLLSIAFSALAVLLAGKALLDAKCLECKALRTGLRCLACLGGVVAVNMFATACDSAARFIAYVVLTL